MQEPSLLGREERFRRLLSAMEGPVSRRWALVQVTAFLQELSALGSEAEAYLLPLSRPLIELSGRLDPVGLRPEQVWRPARLIRELRTNQMLDDAGSLVRAEQLLRLRAALLSAYGGAVVQAAQLVAPEKKIGLKDVPVTSPRKRLEAAVRQVGSASSRKGLEWILAHWGREHWGQEPGRRGALVPVVERLPAWVRRNGRSVGAREDSNVGALRHLQIDVFGRSPVGSDRLKASGQARSDSLAGPVQAARRLLAERRTHLAERYLRGHLNLQGQKETSPPQEGTSTGLAAASLFFCSALEEARERRRFTLRPNVALTGRVNEDGTVRSVESESLSVKVRTAFFSPTETLAVPARQKKEAEEALRSLKKDYPHCQLEVLGTERLRDVFDHRRLTRKVETSWPTYAARQVWSRKGAIAASTVIVALALTLAWLVYGPIDKNPVGATYAGEMMIVENDTGQEIERIEVGEVVVNQNREGKIKTPVAFANVAGDSKNEVFWAADADSASKRMVLRAQAIGADTLLWERPLQFDPSFPEKPSVVGTTFRARDLLAGDLEGDGQSELYVSLKHMPYFPELVLELDPRTGAERQRYVHPGHLPAGLHAVHLDEDSAKELVTGGYSNAFGDPVLAVLEPSYLQGHAPTRGDYEVGGTDLAKHHAYLRFPATRVQREVPKTYQMVRQIEITQSPARITAEYEDGQPVEEPSRNPYVLMHLNRWLRPVGMGTSGQHDQLAERLVEKGRLNAVPGPKDLRRLQWEIQYLNNGGWSTLTKPEK